MSAFSHRASRIVVALLAFVSAFSFVAPAPALALNVQFSCWCQDTSTGTCNHHLIDSGMEDDDPSWAAAGVSALSMPLFGSTIAAIGGAAFTIDEFLERPGLRDRLAGVQNRCPERCAADGGKRAIHFETSYRAEVCRECNADPNSSCTEESGARLEFGEERVDDMIAKCEERKAATIFPIKLGTPIGGVSQVNGLPDYINVAYRYLVTVVLVVAIVMTVWGGFRYLLGASIGSVQQGKETIKDALIGMLIVLGAYTILSTINPRTTILSLDPPEPIECQDISLPAAVKNARCTSDRDCGGGTRCVEGRNYIFSVTNVVEAQAAGTVEGAELSGDFIGSGKAAGLVGLLSHPLGPLSLLTESTEERRVRGRAVTAAVGGFAGGAIARDAEILHELHQDDVNIRVCSTGERGAPCTEDRYCQAGLQCIESWELCWSGSGNPPGAPCDENSQCSNNNCEQVGDTPFKICHMEASETTPCLRAGATAGGFIYPPACSGPPVGEMTCAWCPAEGERNWTFLEPGQNYAAQCKPRSALGTSCSP